MPAKKTATKKIPAKKKVSAKSGFASSGEKSISKPVIKKVEVLIPEKSSIETNAKEKYFEAVGRRKESIARVRLYTKKSADTVEGEKALITINNKDYSNYFSDINLKNVVESPLKKLKSLNRFKATIIVHGGGLRGQADAVKHGLARALVKFDLNFRKKLKKSGFLIRDSRIKERRKYGLKKARKSPQWQKR